LYEISTGKDRNEFPDLPSNLEDLTEEARLLEFNEILLKACHGDPRQRYASASELFEDLSLLQEGKSVKQKRSRERLVAHARKVLLALALVLAVGTGGYLVARKPVRIGNPTPRQLRPDKPEFWRSHHPWRNFDFSPGGDRIVSVSAGATNRIFIWDGKTSINRPLALRGIEGWQVISVWPVPRWAPDGRHFIFQAAKKMSSTAEGAVHVFALFLVDADTGAARQVGPELAEGEKVRDLCWLPDGKAVTYFSFDDRFYTLPLSGGRSLWVDSNLPSEKPRIELGA